MGLCSVLWSPHAARVCVCVFLVGARPWTLTWAGELMSVGAWAQLAVLSGYNKKQVGRAAHAAVTRSLSTRPHDYQNSVFYMYSLLPHLPLPHCCHLHHCATWLQNNAHWKGTQYRTWELPHDIVIGMKTVLLVPQPSSPHPSEAGQQTGRTTETLLQR